MLQVGARLQVQPAPLTNTLNVCYSTLDAALSKGYCIKFNKSICDKRVLPNVGCTSGRQYLQS